MFEDKLIAGMHGFNRFIHLLLALSLGIACAMVIWDVGVKIFHAWEVGNATQGFLQALGSLFILWTLSTLISAEIDYLQTGRVYARVFVVVAIIAVIREIILQPVQVMAGRHPAAHPFNPMEYGLLLAALLVAGVVYRLVSNSANLAEDSTQITLDV